MASEDRGLYRLRTASDVPYAGSYGYGRRDSFAQKLGAILAVVARVAVSVAVLLGWVAGVYLYRDAPIALYEGSESWLTGSHLLIAVGFFCVAMTNRRYGPAYAFAQVVCTAIVIVAFLVFSGGVFSEIFPADTIPPLREAAAVGGAFFAASFVSIVVFDGARGPNWWTAPLFGFLGAAIVYSSVYYAALQAGTNAAWLNHAVQYMGILAGEGILLLIPFAVLRRMIPPMSGFGGY